MAQGLEWRLGDGFEGPCMDKAVSQREEREDQAAPVSCSCLRTEPLDIYRQR